jgi:hypothetical protein
MEIRELTGANFVTSFKPLSPYICFYVILQKQSTFGSLPQRGERAKVGDRCHPGYLNYGTAVNLFSNGIPSAPKNPFRLKYYQFALNIMTFIRKYYVFLLSI